MIEILCIHHEGHPLQDGKNLRPLPSLQPSEVAAKIVAEQRRSLSCQAFPFLGGPDNNAAAVLPVAVAMDQLSFVQPLEDPGYSGRTDAHPFRDLRRSSLR